MINSPDANSHLCILLARKQPEGYACVTKVRHTSPVQSQPVLIWRISQSPPNSVVWYEPVSLTVRSITFTLVFWL